MDCPIINLAKELISIPSVSPFDLGCQKIISDRLLKLGFNIVCLKDKNTNNLWAFKGTGITLAFAGHTDVVSAVNMENWNITQPFTPIVKNGYLFGRGAADMKGSIAAMVIAAERFIHCRPNYFGCLAFLITSDEESIADFGTISIVEYLKSIGYHINYTVIGEPTSKNTVGDYIKVGRRGSLHAHLLIYGLQGHIAYPEIAENPIHNSILFLKHLINMHWSDGNKYFEPTSMQIFNIFSDSSSSNIIPGALHIEFNFRFGTDITVSSIQNKVKILLSLFNVRYSIKWFLSGEPFLTYSDYLVNIVKKSIKKISLIDTVLSTSGGTSDGRFIKNISSELIELGPSNNTIHKINECVNIQDLHILSLIYEDIMKNILI